MRFLTVEEVGEILSLTPRTVRSMISRGEIHAIKISKFLRISEDEIKKLVKS